MQSRFRRFFEEFRRFTEDWYWPLTNKIGGVGEGRKKELRVRWRRRVRRVKKFRGIKKSGGQKKLGTHKFESKHILIIMIPMYKRERVRVLVTASSHLKGQVHKSI